MACRSLPLFLLAITSTGVAQQPGQLARATFSVPASLPLAPAGQPSSALAEIPAVSPHDRFMNRLWLTSVATMVAATAADASTSWSYREGNGILASHNGTFGAKGVGIKAGVTGALLVPQYFLRHHSELRSKFIAANFVGAAIFGVTSIHNVRVVNSLK